MARQKNNIDFFRNKIVQRFEKIHEKKQQEKIDFSVNF